MGGGGGGNPGAQARATAADQYARSQKALTEGQAQGRGKFTGLTGQTMDDVSSRMQKAIGQVEGDLGRYSGASDQIRQRGNQAAMMARQRSGQLGTQTAGQQAQIGTAASQGAANQRYQEQQQAEQNYQQMAQGLMRNAASLEQGYAAQQLATVRDVPQIPAPGGK